MSSNPTIIDTQAVLKKVHATLARAELVENEEEKARLRNVANSALSSVIIYLRHSTAVVQRKHYDSIKRLDEVET